MSIQCNIKKFVPSLTFLVCLLLVAACGKEEKQVVQQSGETKDPARYVLTYLADENGRVAGKSSQTVNPGEDGEPVKAEPVEGYIFKGWSDGLADAIRTDLNVQENLTVTARFTSAQHTLTYLAGDNGSLGGNTPQTVAHGASGSPVTAIPNPNYHFTGWSDGVASPERVDSNVAADIEVIAEFALNRYTLTYSAGDNGTIEGAVSQTADHGGTGSRVKAVPAENHVFSGWSDGVKTPERIDSNVSADIDVRANFTLKKYTLTYQAGKNGMIVGTSTQRIVHGGDGGEVTAVPDEHYHFDGWSDGVIEPVRKDTGVMSDLTVTARFALDQYTLSYDVSGTGSIEGAGVQTVPHGNNGTAVTAVPAAGYHFVKWSDGVTTPTRTDEGLTGNKSVEAVFAINEYDISFIAGEYGVIDGAAFQTVEHGGDAKPVTAVADTGYHFVSWSDGVATARRQDSGITGRFSVEAEFAVNTYPVGGRVEGLVAGTQLVLQNNATDDLAIDENGPFVFSKELLNDAGYDVRVLTQPLSPNQLCTVEKGSGRIAAAQVEDVRVRCELIPYRIGGTVNGLPEGDRVVLQNNHDDSLSIGENGAFFFSTALDDGSRYDVRVVDQPGKKHWTCDVINGAGSVGGQEVKEIVVDCYPQVVVKATAGIRRVRMEWNSEDFSGVDFNLCRAEEDIPENGYGQCRQLDGGTVTDKVLSPLIVGDLKNDTTYRFQVVALYSGGRKTFSEVASSTPFGGLNDTGIDWCADSVTNYYSTGSKSEKMQGCAQVEMAFPGQDAVYGQDALALARKLRKTGTGSSGFDFSKICRNGQLAGQGNCPPNPVPGNAAKNWGCSQDNVTGLMWEVKSEKGVNGRQHTYSWYNPDYKTNGGHPGLKSGGACEGESCNTYAYITAINDQKLCGYDDWRLPTRRELLSIVHNGLFKPAADSQYFPNTLADYYWTSSTYADQNNSAWQVNFLYGEAFPNEKKQGNAVRLVRGKTRTFGFDNP